MKIFAGVCLIENNSDSINNAINTAKSLAYINEDIFFRCKLWGGGFTYEKYVKGIGKEGLQILKEIKSAHTRLRVGVEIRTQYEIEHIFDVCDYVWVGARNSQNYSFLKKLGDYIKERQSKMPVMIKRSPGMTYEETYGIHDICEKIYNFKPMIVERGINTFAKILPKTRWLADFNCIIKLKQKRPDIELCFDPSHACGDSEMIFSMTKAAYETGIRNFMFEVYDDPKITKTDIHQAISMEKFKTIYNYLNKDWKGIYD